MRSLKMKAAGSSNILLTIYETTQCHNAGNLDLKAYI
jgi:hypothetical protein